MKLTITSKQSVWSTLKSLSHYHELLYFFIWRDIKLRYKQTFLGFLWVILQPLVMMAIFSIFFGMFIKLPTDGIPYPVFFLCAFIPWMLVSEGLTRSTASVVGNTNIITKIYFPRLILPLSGVISPLLDFAVSFGILIVVALYFGLFGGVGLLLIPILVFATILTALGAGVWLAALNAEYRDFQYTVPFLLQVWLYLSPVIYSSTSVPDRFQFLYSLNPMVGIINGFRWAVFGQGVLNVVSIGISVVVSVVILGSGMIYFMKKEKEFADIV